MNIKWTMGWFLLGFLVACMFVIPYHVIVMKEINDKYTEECIKVDVTISDDFRGTLMRMEGEQMMCASNWKYSFMYFPGFEPYLERMWRDEQKQHPFKERIEE